MSKISTRKMVVEMQPCNPAILSDADLSPIHSNSQPAPQAMSLQDLPLVLTVDDLMEVLAIGRNTAYALVRSGQIRSIKVGKIYRIPRDAVEEFLKK